MLEKFANLVCEILEIGESQWKVHGSAWRNQVHNKRNSWRMSL